MKMLTRLLVLAVAAFASTSCNGITVSATAPINRDFVFTFDSDNGTTEIATLSQADILGELDIPDDATVDRVDIERVRLTLAPGASNEAATSTITFTYAAQNFSEDLDITVAAVDQEPVDALVASTLRVLESDVLGVLTGFGPAQITVQGDVSNIASSGSRLVLDATLEVRLTVTYLFCQELSWGPFGPTTPDCIAPE